MSRFSRDVFSCHNIPTADFICEYVCHPVKLNTQLQVCLPYFLMQRGNAYEERGLGEGYSLPGV